MIVLLDAGHGGMINGKYQTPGKRSPKRKDGTILYEGVNNRRIVDQLKWAFKIHKIDFVDVVDTEEDKSLSERIKTANKVSGDTLYLSIHSNAAGKDGEFSNAKGFGTYIYTSPSQKTRDYAKIIHSHLGINLSGSPAISTRGITGEMRTFFAPIRIKIPRKLTQA